MANSRFNNYALLNASPSLGQHSHPDLNTATIGAILLDTADHTVNLATDIDEADITNAAIVSSVNLTGVTVGVTGPAVFDHDDIVFPLVTGDVSEEVLLYVVTGTATLDVLIARFDDFVSGMPVTPNGGNVTSQPAASGSLLF